MCAWFAVGVLTPADLDFDKITCPGFGTTDTSAPAPSSACQGGTGSYVCFDGTPGFATACDKTKSDVFCADLAQHCKPTSASDPRATVGPDGALVCE